jgi:hypothetical protein
MPIDQTSIHPHFGSSRVDPESLEDEACTTVAAEWIQRCQAEHNCHPYRDPELAPLPKRLVDVGNNEGLPFVVNSGGKTGRYVTLSHCWGSVLIHGTTKSNLDSRMHEIPSLELPKTFQDAVLITAG